MGKSQIESFTVSNIKSSWNKYQIPTRSRVRRPTTAPPRQHLLLDTSAEMDHGSVPTIFND